MSYLALARKWRPTKFKEVVGQAHVLTALENALSQNRLHHAYLFSGTRGVGKTTTVACLLRDLTVKPALLTLVVNATCKEIDEGRFIDLLEIDASRTKVGRYPRASGQCSGTSQRVVALRFTFIDEVHMLRHSFNALLKMKSRLSMRKFLLATTDPQKLPVRHLVALFAVPSCQADQR
ncbi:AAA family ATPase [Vibrio chagasii]|nr:AAA family ATPase [Vibrio chagasii]